MSATKEITGLFVREIHRNDEFMIGKIRVQEGDGYGREISVMGEAQPEELQKNLEYRFYGAVTSHPKFGEQIKFKSFVMAEPHGEAAIVTYLQNAPHVGVATARKLWEKFRSNAVRILRTDPDVAAAAVNARYFSHEKAVEAAKYLQIGADLEHCMLELMGLFDKRGFPKNAAREAFRLWSGRAPQVAKKNTHKLMQIRGIGFGKADQMYLDLGLPANRLRRQMYCGLEAIKDSARQNGHTWVPISIFSNGIKEKVSGTEIRPVKALQLALKPRRPILSIRRDCLACGGSREASEGQPCEACGGRGGELWVSERQKAAAEDFAAMLVAQALRESGAEWPFVDEDNFPTLKQHQRDQLSVALCGELAILTGYPGTGKTFVVAALVRLINKIHGPGHVAIAAPTGKAAVRCTEVMNKMGVNVTARTIHQLLRVVSLEDGQFEHDAGNPLPYRFVIFDEFSMVDTPLFASLLQARARGTHYLFVGDPNQLPPVGHGAPLRDMIAAGVPCGRLVDIERNSGTIVETCKAVCEGKDFTFDETLDLSCERPKNMRLIRASNKNIQDKTIELVSMIRDKRPFDLDPVWDCQMIVAVNAKSVVSRKALNGLLQQELNPHGKTAKGSPFRVGDKVVQLSSQYFNLFDMATGRSVSDPQWHPEFDELEINGKGLVRICNGEFGRVMAVEEKKTIVRFTTPNRTVLIPRGNGGESKDEEASDTGCDLDLGYAATCHKMQGSEVRCAIVILDEYAGASGPRGICTREWFTTAITRGRDLTLCVGRKETAEKMCRRVALPLRKTFMKELIEFNMEELSANGGQTCQRKYQVA